MRQPDAGQGGELLRLLLILPALYLLVAAYYYTQQRSYLYYPDTRRPDPHLAETLHMTPAVTTTADGLLLEGWYRAPADGKPVIVLFHGNGGNIAGRARKADKFLAKGYGVLLAEYRGYGGNPGKPTEKGFYQDARAYMAWLAEHDIPPERTVLYGESIGSGSAVQMASEYPAVRGLVLESPFTSLAETAQSHMSYLPVRFMIIDRFDNLSKISGLKTPVLILHGAKDAIVPYGQGKRLFEAAREPKFLETYPLAGHNDLYENGAADRVLGFLEWLEQS